MSQQSLVMRKTRNATTNEQDIQSTFKCEMWAIFFYCQQAHWQTIFQWNMIYCIFFQYGSWKDCATNFSVLRASQDGQNNNSLIVDSIANQLLTWCLPHQRSSFWQCAASTVEWHSFHGGFLGPKAFLKELISSHSVIWGQPKYEKQNKQTTNKNIYKYIVFFSCFCMYLLKQ